MQIANKKMTEQSKTASHFSGGPKRNTIRDIIVWMQTAHSILQDALEVVALPFLISPQLDLLDVHALLQVQQDAALLKHPL